MFVLVLSLNIFYVQSLCISSKCILIYERLDTSSGNGFLQNARNQQKHFNKHQCKQHPHESKQVSGEPLLTTRTNYPLKSSLKHLLYSVKRLCKLSVSVNKRIRGINILLSSVTDPSLRFWSFIQHS